jgi:hypothetical protein
MMEMLLQGLQEFKRDSRWLEQHYDELAQQYTNQYVAVYRERVIDHDRDLKALMKRLQQSYPTAADHIAVEYVTSEQFEGLLPWYSPKRCTQLNREWWLTSGHRRLAPAPL